jgi:hypothetical protein
MDAHHVTLDSTQFDRLLCLLGDLAEGRSVNIVVTLGGSKPVDPGAPAGPLRPSVPSSVHMVVPR